jgi:hypothetical protein
MTRTMTLLALSLTFAARADAPDRMDRAIQLPAAAQQLRDKGLPASEVATAVNAAKESGLPASDAADLLEEGAKGPNLDNFGKFVKSKLDEGLRGRDLANAIHEEKESRGKTGKGPDGQGPPGQDGEKGGKGPPGDPGGGPPPDKGGGGEGKGGKGKSGKGGH